MSRRLVVRDPQTARDLAWFIGSPSFSLWGRLDLVLAPDGRGPLLSEERLADALMQRGLEHRPPDVAAELARAAADFARAGRA